MKVKDILRIVLMSEKWGHAGVCAPLRDSSPGDGFCMSVGLWSRAGHWSSSGEIPMP